ncbi:hypothetical protein D3C76_1427020 [compost metagenome]
MQVPAQHRKRVSGYFPGYGIQPHHDGPEFQSLRHSDAPHVQPGMDGRKSPVSPDVPQDAVHNQPRSARLHEAFPTYVYEEEGLGRSRPVQASLCSQEGMYMGRVARLRL